MRVLQVANVGNIVGGTAACAWSLVQALPECEHGVLFFSEPTEETRRALAGCEIGQIGRLELGHVRRFGADVVVLHNTPAHRVLGEMPALVVLYHHSRTARAGRREGARREERGARIGAHDVPWRGTLRRCGTVLFALVGRAVRRG